MYSVWVRFDACNSGVPVRSMLIRLLDTRRVSSNHYAVLAYLVLKFVVGAFILLIAWTYVDYARIFFSYLIRLLDHIMTNLRCVLINVCDPSLTEPGLHLVIPYALFVLVLIDFYCGEHIVG